MVLQGEGLPSPAPVQPKLLLYGSHPKHMLVKGVNWSLMIILIMIR